MNLPRVIAEKVQKSFASRQHSLLGFAIGLLLIMIASPVQGAPPTQTTPNIDTLSTQQWEQIDHSIERALHWLASRQQPDGSFPTRATGQPAITSLITMAFLANGHLPGQGPYGEHLQQAIAYVQASQKPNGLLALPARNGQKISRRYADHLGKAIAYNHAISALMLSEAYSLQGRQDEGAAREIIEKALQASLTMQRWPRTRPSEQGGWRYAHDNGYADADLSLTGWELMFLRSAKNGGFDVPEKVIEDAVKYVRRCYLPEQGTFTYYLYQDRVSRGMAGAGVLALAHAGLHNTKEAQQAGQWILHNGFENYNQIKKFNQTGWYNDRYHYGIFYCSQAMYQLGGKYWREFFPKTSAVLVQNQRPNGSWAIETEWESKRFGNLYTTSLSVLALSAPNQLLPIFQR